MAKAELMALLKDISDWELFEGFLKYSWYPIDRCMGPARLVWLSDQPFNFPGYMYRHLPVVQGTDQRFLATH